MSLFTDGEHILVDNTNKAFIIEIHTSTLQNVFKFTTLLKTLTNTSSLNKDADLYQLLQNLIQGVVYLQQQEYIWLQFTPIL